jgi:hypothetical protein
MVGYDKDENLATVVIKILKEKIKRSVLQKVAPVVI